MLSNRENIKTLSDETLVDYYLKSQQNYYFDELYDRYADKIYRKCLSFTFDKEKAKDFTHDIFLKLIVKIGAFSATAKFSTWLFAVTYNYCMDQIRVSKKTKIYSMADEYDFAEDDENEDFETQNDALKRGMSKLDSDDKAILMMKYQDDFSIKEIAETLKVSESAVKMRLSRSKERLKKYYLENVAVFALIIIKILYFFKHNG